MNKETDVLPHIIYEVLSGSHAYGLNSPDSDEDVRAAFVPRPRHALGLNQYRHQKGEGDEVYVPITRLAQHLAEGSTTWVEILYVEPRFIRVQTPFIMPFLENRQLFLTKSVVSKTCGMVKGLATQAERLSGKKPGDDRAIRKQLMHAVRAGRMVVEALEQGRLNVYRAEDQEHLLAIRNGPTALQAAQEECMALMQKLNEGIASSPLQEKPDETAIDALTVYTVTEYWKFQGWL